ncbi:MAG: class I SAM-dependent methyltransferase [candidate division Zixibacteria bacterium]|nr:class I SAM-dependent methyltransferase [candidate division Zixibacteria bacterium]
MSNSNYSKKLIKEMNQYYEARAPWHDIFMGYESERQMEEFKKSIIEILTPVIIGKRVIEIACGTGNWTQIIAKRAESVTAIDVSPTALGLAQRKLVNHCNVSLIQCDAYNLNCIGGLYDVSFAADWWSHIPMDVLPLFVESLMSKLKKRSKVIFLDMSFREDHKVESCYYDLDDNRITRRMLPSGSNFMVVKNFPHKEALKKFLSPYAKRVDYYELKALCRWMVIFTPK